MRGYILLPFIFFLLLGGTLFLSALKLESLQNTEIPIKHLSLNFHNFKEILKLEIKNKHLQNNSFFTFSKKIDKFHYKAVIKKLDYKDANIFFVDIYGTFFHKEQKFSQNKQIYLVIN